MSEDTITRYILGEDNKMREIKVPKEESMRDIKQILDKDKDFLEIMAKM